MKLPIKTVKSLKTDMQPNAKAILCLKPEEPVSHLVTTIVIQLELILYKRGEGTWEGERVTAEEGGLYSGRRLKW